LEANFLLLATIGAAGAAWCGVPASSRVSSDHHMAPLTRPNPEPAKFTTAHLQDSASRRCLRARL